MWVPAQPGNGAWGRGEGRMDCSSGTGRVTGQQWAPPQPAVPLLFAEGPAAWSPTGTMLVPAALNKLQLCLEMGWQQGL